MDNKEREYLYFYMEQTWNEMRHIEVLRERVTVLIITIASISIGFIVQQKFAQETKVMIWLVIMLGILGILVGLKLFQIHQMGQRRLDKWNSYLIEHCGDAPKVITLRREADQENKSEFKLLSKIPHNYFWTTINLFIICIGILMLTMVKDSKPITVEKLNNNITKSTTTSK